MKKLEEEGDYKQAKSIFNTRHNSVGCDTNPREKFHAEIPTKL